MLDRNKMLTPEKLRSDDFTSKDIGHIIRNENKGAAVKKYAHMLPWLLVEATAQPMTKTFVRRINNEERQITSHVVKVQLKVTPDFRWNDHHHGSKSQAFWLWLQDHDSLHIRHHEHVVFRKQEVVDKVSRTIHFSIVLPDARQAPTHYMLHVDSDRWLGCDIDEEVYCEPHVEVTE